MAPPHPRLCRLRSFWLQAGFLSSFFEKSVDQAPAQRRARLLETRQAGGLSPLMWVAPPHPMVQTAFFVCKASCIQTVTDGYRLSVNVSICPLLSVKIRLISPIRPIKFTSACKQTIRSLSNRGAWGCHPPSRATARKSRTKQNLCSLHASGGTGAQPL